MTAPVDPLPNTVNPVVAKLKQNQQNQQNSYDAGQAYQNLWNEKKTGIHYGGPQIGGWNKQAAEAALRNLSHAQDKLVAAGGRSAAPPAPGNSFIPNPNVPPHTIPGRSDSLPVNPTNPGRGGGFSGRWTIGGNPSRGGDYFTNPGNPNLPPMAYRPPGKQPLPGNEQPGWNDWTAPGVFKDYPAPGKQPLPGNEQPIPDSEYIGPGSQYDPHLPPGSDSPIYAQQMSQYQNMLGQQGKMQDLAAQYQNMIGQQNQAGQGNSALMTALQRLLGAYA